MTPEEKRAHRAAWLAGLKAGDEVVVKSSRYSRTTARLGTVARLTATRIVVESESGWFRRDDGRKPASGRYYSGSDWLEEPTPEARDAARLFAAYLRANELLTDVERRLSHGGKPPEGATVESLNALSAALKPFAKETK